MTSASAGTFSSYLKVYGARLASVALGLALTIASARLLGPAGRGEFAAALAGVVVGVQLLNLGLSSALLLIFSEEPRFIRRSLVSLGALTGAWCVLLVLVGLSLSSLSIVDHFPFLRWWPLWSVWIPLQLLGIYQAACLTALRDYKAIIVREIGGRIAIVALGLSALLLFRGTVWPFLAALVLADGLIALGGWFLVLRSAPTVFMKTDSKALHRRAMVLAVRAYPVLFLSYLVIRSDVLLLRALRGPSETGIYSIAAQFIDLALILPATVAAFLVPEIVGPRAGAAFVVEQARRVFLYATGVSVIVAALGAPAIRFVFGDAYRGAYVPLLLLLPGFIALSVQNVLMQHFNVQGFPLFVAGYWAAATVLNLGANLVLVPRFGMYAAAATSSVSYGLVCALALRRFRRETATPLRALLFAGRAA